MILVQVFKNIDYVLPKITNALRPNPISPNIVPETFHFLGCFQIVAIAKPPKSIPMIGNISNSANSFFIVLA